jgi:WD40 repeat protein
MALAVGLTLAAFGWLEALRATEETRRRAYAAEISAAFQALDENNLERAIDLLGRQRPKPGEQDLRGFEWRHLWQLCRSDAKATFDGAWALHPAFSPDGRWLANGGDQTIIRELPSLAEVKTIPVAATTPAFSPDGKLLATGPQWSDRESGQEFHVSLWSTESWEEKHRLPGARYPTVFSPDGRLLVTAGHQGGLHAGQFQVWDNLPSGENAAEATPVLRPGTLVGEETRSRRSDPQPRGQVGGDVGAVLE